MIRLHVNDLSLMLIHFSREFDVDVDVDFNVILRETKKSYATRDQLQEKRTIKF